MNQSSLFDTLRSMVKNNQKITKSKVSARMQVQHLFKDVVREIDLGSEAYAQARLEAAQRNLKLVKQRAEWQDVALAVHLIYTSCRHCHSRTAHTDDLLLVRRRLRDNTIHYQPLRGKGGFDNLPIVELVRQRTVPLCHFCQVQHITERQWKSANPRQMQLF
jgi:hypothetical protein